MSKKNLQQLTIISGGQTGVDRGALDAALAIGVTCGGWCPEGRLAEDGVIPSKYPLIELPGADYKQRTLCNVLASDGTLIIYFSHIEGGTEDTLRFCMEWKKPYLLIDATELSVVRSAERIYQFIIDFAVATLNVAGPRESTEAQAYTYSKSSILSLLTTQ